MYDLVASSTEVADFNQLNVQWLSGLIEGLLTSPVEHDVGTGSLIVIKSSLVYSWLGQSRCVGFKRGGELHSYCMSF